MALASARCLGCLNTRSACVLAIVVALLLLANQWSAAGSVNDLDGANCGSKHSTVAHTAQPCKVAARQTTLRQTTNPRYATEGSEQTVPQHESPAPLHPSDEEPRDAGALKHDIDRRGAAAADNGSSAAQSDARPSHSDRLPDDDAADDQSAAHEREQAHFVIDPYDSQAYSAIGMQRRLDERTFQKPPAFDGDTRARLLEDMYRELVESSQKTDVGLRPAHGSIDACVPLRGRNRAHIV